MRFTGRIDNRSFRIEYAKASIAVIPSIYEGFGLPAGEAMACGVPVVATTGGALPEVVGDAGILTAPGNVQALAAGIKRLLDNPDYAKQLGMIGYKRIIENFTWEKAAQKSVGVYKRTVAEWRIKN